MIDFEMRGAIFDMDDTLLDNSTGGQTIGGLHEESRLAATQEVGRRYGIRALVELSAEDNYNAFMNAPAHTLESAIWQVLLLAGEVEGAADPTHPLVTEIAQLKNDLHEDILLNKAQEVPGASAFVRQLAAQGLEGRLAIASSAVRRDIDLFLRKIGMDALFPPERILSKESITHPKPHPEVFNRAFASLHLPEAARAQVCAFEDDPRGVAAAKTAGLFTCAITTRFDRQTLTASAVPADIIADSYQEFSQLLGLPTPNSTP